MNNNNLYLDQYLNPKMKQDTMFEYDLDLVPHGKFWLNLSMEELNNTSNLTTILTLFHGYPDDLLMFAALCCIIFSVIGIPGNIVTITALIYSKHLHNATTAFIINLCFSDGLVCLISLPLAASTFMQKQWVHGEALCTFSSISRFGSFGVSMLSVINITINRYVLIVHPKRYTKLYKKRNIILMIFLIWVLSFGCLIPTMVGIWGKFGFDMNTGTCTIRSVNGHSPKLIIFIVMLALPVPLVIVCYCRIFWVVRKSQHNLQKNTPTKDSNKNIKGKHTLHHPTPMKLAPPEMHPVPRSPRTDAKRHQRSKTARDLKLLRMIMVIFTTSLSCYMPLSIVKIMEQENEHPVANIVGYVTMYLSSCLNPVIYVMMSRDYRRAYKNLISCASQGTMTTDNGSRTPSRNGVVTSGALSYVLTPAK